MALTDPFFLVVGVSHMAFFFVALFFIGNVLPVLSLLFVRTLSSRLHTRIMCSTAVTAWRLLIDYVCMVGGLTEIVTGDVEILEKKYTGSKLVVSNHVSYTDSLVVYEIARRFGQLGHIRSFAKKSLKFTLPIVGWFMGLSDFIFLSRDWDKDQQNIKRQLDLLAEQSKHFTTGAFWLHIFPEGTRLRPKKLAEAHEFAKAQGLPIFENVLIPRVKGLQCTLVSARDSFDGILDITLGYSKFTKTGHARPSVGDLLLGGLRAWPVHVHIRVIPIKDVPTDNDEIKKWAMKLFSEKDQLLKEFKAKGAFPGKSVVWKGASWGGMLANELYSLLTAASLAFLLHWSFFSAAVSAVA